MGRNSGAAADSMEPHPPRQWARTPRTRAQILAAAEQVFQESGYADANIADIVERAGVSVGSVYHHFGSKAEVYLALWQERQKTSFAAASEAVAKARRVTPDDPVELFLAATRAFLERNWKRRHLMALFTGDDGPPGFEALQRLNWRKWISQNASLLGVRDDTAGRILVAAATSIIREASREIEGSDDEVEVERGIAATLEYLGRMLRG